MKILTISDEIVPAIYSLNIKQRFSDVDLLLGCGDLPFYYVEYVITMLGMACYYVWGNHDGPVILADGTIQEYIRGAICVDGRLIEHEGMLIGGLGGSIRYKPEGRHQYTEAEMFGRVWRMVPGLLFNRLRFGRYLDILLTHAPPLDIHNGPDYPHRGFRAFRWLMHYFQPRYLIHGHIHLSYGYNSGVETQCGATTVINTAGYRQMTFDLHRQ
jgi:Icc-related predicted phosphoesterase